MQSTGLGHVLRAAVVSATVAYIISDPNQTWAAGFELREGSADWMANAFAGDTAKAYDAATVWSNPAGMVRLNQNEVDGSVNGIFPTSTFSGANFVGSASTTPGTSGGNLTQSIATGGLYGVWSVTPEFKIGLGADVPFGQRITNPTNFVGRYQSLVSSISDEAFTLSAAYKFNEQWSIGGGPVIDVISARLTQALNTGPLAAFGDPIADLHGEDVSAGFNLGLLYQPTQDLRLGLDYRSRIQHNIDGTQSVSVPIGISALAPTVAAGLAAQNSPASTKLTLPDSVTAGLYWQTTPRLALLVDVSWTDWSLVKTIDVTPSSALATSTTIIENWRNTFAISVGANYQLSPALMLQGGAGFDESPVTDSNRTSRIPDSNRYLIGIGAQYQVMPNWTLQVAYAHVFFDSAPLTTQASATSGILSGSYSTAANTASLGVRVRF